mgnify:CR=1 FL=1
MQQRISSEGIKNVYIKNIPGPEGVRGRNSDNKLINEKLNWAPSFKLKKGLEKTYDWIKEQIETDAKNVDLPDLSLKAMKLKLLRNNKD